MSPQHKSAMLFARAVDQFRSGDQTGGRQTYRKAKAIEESLVKRSCHWCGQDAQTVLIDDSPLAQDYACRNCELSYGRQYDRAEPIE